jgi:lipoprotein-releasing system ATP-binding protein
MSEPVLQLRGIERRFRQGEDWIEVLRGVSVQVGRGKVIALVGASGAGKSTLLQIAGLLEQPTAGEVVIEGQACARLSDAERTRVRRERIGFVYQFHHLLPEFSALENIVLPQLIAGRDKRAARERAAELLTALGLGARLEHRPSQLSGGEQQRVAIARALANRPTLLLADEPTGNLDEATGRQVARIFLEVARSAGAAALIATHNPELASQMDETLHLHEGRIERPRAASSAA